MKIPGELALYDVRRDGKVVIGRVDRRLEAISLPSGDAQEPDISWFDRNGLSDISRDGRTLLEDGTNGLKVYMRKFDGSLALWPSSSEKAGRLDSHPTSARCSSRRRPRCVWA